MSTLPAIAERQSPRSLAAGSILRRMCSFPVLLAAMLAGGVFVFARFNILDPDTWWHLKVGEQILRSGTWPRVDPYSSTVSGTPWIAYEWLGEVLMALAARMGGLRAATALLLGLAGILLVLLYYYAWLRSGNSKAAFIACVLVLPPTLVFLTLRPQLLGYIFLLTTLICLEHFRQGKHRAVWILPPLFLLWVNTHGTFAFGLLTLGIYWLSGKVGFQKGGLVAQRWAPKQSYELLTVCLLCVLVLPVTPYGSRVAAYPLEMSLSQPVNVANILEWQPLGFDVILGKVLLGLLLLFFFAFVVARPQLRLEDMALLLFGIYAACVHRRFIPVLVLVVAPLLGVMLARWVPRYQPAKDQFVLNAAILGLILAGLAYSFPSSERLEEMAAQRYPRDAVEYLRRRPVRAPMLNDYGWGGYLIWSIGPQQKVFIDGRADIYEYAGVLDDYFRISRLDPETLPLLRKYGLESCLIQRKAPLGTLLAALPDWERIYSDDLAAIYVHKQRHSGPPPVASSGGQGNVLGTSTRGREDKSRQSSTPLVHKW